MTRDGSVSTAKVITVIGGSVVAVLALTVACVFVIGRSLAEKSDESPHVDQINDELRRKLDEFEVREESTYMPTKFSKATWDLAGSLIKDGYLGSDRSQLSFDAKTVSAAVVGRLSLLSPDSDPHSLKWKFAGQKETDKEVISSCLICSTSSGYRASFYDRVQQEWDKVKPLLPVDDFRRSQKMIILAASLHEMSSSEQEALRDRIRSHNEQDDEILVGEWDLKSRPPSFSLELLTDSWQFDIYCYVREQDASTEVTLRVECKNEVPIK